MEVFAPCCHCAQPCHCDETCPVSTGGGTRRVHLVREEGGRGAQPCHCAQLAAALSEPRGPKENLRRASAPAAASAARFYARTQTELPPEGASVDLPRRAALNYLGAVFLAVPQKSQRLPTTRCGAHAGSPLEPRPAVAELSLSEILDGNADKGLLSPRPRAQRSPDTHPSGVRRARAHRGGALQGWLGSSRTCGGTFCTACAPPPSLLLPLPVSLLYTHSLPP